MDDLTNTCLYRLNVITCFNCYLYILYMELTVCVDNDDNDFIRQIKCYLVQGCYWWIYIFTSMYSLDMHAKQMMSANQLKWSIYFQSNNSPNCHHINLKINF